MKCTKCNHEYDDSLSACPLCGEPAPSKTAAADQESRYEEPRPQYAAPVPAATPAPKQPENSGAAPLILGILSLMLPMVGIVLAIIAIVMGNTQRKEFPAGTTHHALGHAGWVLGIIGLVLQAILVIWYFAIIGMVLNFVQDAMRYSLPYSYDIF